MAIEQGWPNAAVAFLAAHLPRGRDRPGWVHNFSGAYQMATMAIVALGQAEETDWGAVPVAHPDVPEKLPRWDDVAVAVLSLARQQGLLIYRLPDGRPPPTRGRIDIRLKDAPPPTPPNIAAAHGLGPALVDPSFDERSRALGFRPPPEPAAGPTLTALGLIADGAWTPAAELVLWRERVPTWNLDIIDDPRFHAAVDLALATLPGSLREQIASLVSISEADVAAAGAAHRQAMKEARARHGSKALLGPVPDRAGLLRGLTFSRKNDLDWLFYRYWRLPDGWLSETQAAHALEIFHDPLAQSMRGAVLARLHPDRPMFAEP